MEIGTLIYLKDGEYIYKYIAYRPDTKKYVLEMLMSINGRCYNDKYIDISKEEFESAAIAEAKVYIALIKGKIKECKNKIKEIESSKNDVSKFDKKLENLNDEKSRLESIKERSDTQEKALKELEKAIKRQHQKIRSSNHKFSESNYYDIRKMEDSIERLDNILNYIKKLIS